MYEKNLNFGVSLVIYYVWLIELEFNILLPKFHSACWLDSIVGNWHKQAASFMTMQRIIRYFQFCRTYLYILVVCISFFCLALCCNQPWITHADRSSAL